MPSYVPTYFFAGCCVVVAYVVSIGLAVAYSRVYHSVLTRVPGPKLAALTYWYEGWYDCFKHGRYAFHIAELHKQYGPIVRINPNEVHIDDPEFFDTFYSDNKLDKDAWFYSAFGDNGAAVGTAKFETHKARRGAMAKFFSTANVARLEPKVISRVQKLLDRIQEHKEVNKPVDISNAFRCFATDVVSSYAAPHTRDFLSSPDFASSFNRVLRDFSELMIWHRHLWGLVFPIMNAMPKSLMAKLDPSGATLAVAENQEGLLREAKTVVDRKGLPEKEQPIVLDAIYTSPLLGPEDKTVKRMLAETQALLGAGTETTGNTLSVLTYHVLSKPDILKRLKSELSQAAGRMSSSRALMDCRALEPLPYLQACIKEALRLATGVCSRLPRSSRVERKYYGEGSALDGTRFEFPRGTVVSMSILDLHYNGKIFEAPGTFDPLRWLESDGEKLQKMEKAFAPFGRGTRQCIGLDLAKSELLLMAGNLFHRFDLELYQTTARDVSIAHDYFAPFGPKDSKGVRVTVK